MAEVITEIFKESDDGDGLLTTEELVRLEETLGVEITEVEAWEIIDRYDSNGDGMMDLEEFILYKEAKM